MKKNNESKTKVRRSKPIDPQEKENQLISLAMKLAEQQLRDGTAKSQVIAHFLNLATTKTKLENDKLKTDLKVAEAKIKYMEDQTSGKELFEQALKAFSSYGGNSRNEEGEDYED